MAETEFNSTSLSDPENPSFLDSLPGPLLTIAREVMEAKDASVALDTLEVQLRQQLLYRVDTQQELGDFWKDSTLMCWHMVYMAEKGEEERYKGLAAVRKLPILLMEDILESFPLDKALEFFNNHVKPMSSRLFGPELWYNAANPKMRPCWLPFLKLANNFLKRLSVKASSSTSEPGYKDAIASIMLILCQIYPLSEKSATRAWGSYNDQANTDYEEKEEFELEQAQLLKFAAANKEDEDDGSVPADYTIYESFWKLQHDLSRPNALHLSDFLQRLRSLLTTLEHTPVKKKVAKTRIDSDNRLKASTNRYLTGSRLLSIQLQDANFRVPILSQILIVCHHLIQISPVVLKAQLSEWQNRANNLLIKAAPDVHELLHSILANSEESWRQWKSNKCSPDLDQTHSETLVGRKRKQESALSSSALDHDNKGDETNEKDLFNDLPGTSCKMRRAAPTLENHIEDYVDALDPESGIEAEYHPKNDSLFCWRAMRLLSTKHLSDLHHLHRNGDFENVVRQVFTRDYEINIPGEMHAVEEELFTEDEESLEKNEEDVQDNQERTEDTEDPPLKDEDVDMGDVEKGDAEVEDVPTEKVEKDAAQDENLESMQEEEMEEDVMPMPDKLQKKEGAPSTTQTTARSSDTKTKVEATSPTPKGDLKVEPAIKHDFSAMDAETEGRRHQEPNAQRKDEHRPPSRRGDEMRGGKKDSDDGRDMSRDRGGNRPYNRGGDDRRAAPSRSNGRPDDRGRDRNTRVAGNNDRGGGARMPDTGPGRRGDDRPPRHNDEEPRGGGGRRGQEEARSNFGARGADHRGNPPASGRYEERRGGNDRRGGSGERQADERPNQNDKRGNRSRGRGPGHRGDRR